MNIQVDTDSVLNEEKGYQQRISRSRLRFTPHGRSRGRLRNISDQQCLSVLKRGTKKQEEYGRWKFSAEGLTVITEADKTTIVTSWRAPGHGITLKKVDITPEMKKDHLLALRRLRQTSTWTSHAVAVVDQSGSMREIDMDKLVMRSDLVWLNLAVNVVAKCLQSGERTSTDVLSVVSMRTQSEVILRHHPFDWILYNKLVGLLETSEASGGGCYIPALEAATDLLGSCRNRHCAKSLLFFSDGRPSDHIKKGDGCGTDYERLMKKYTSEKIAELASIAGKRLSICGVGIGQTCDHKFSIIKAMLDEAKEYECNVVFEESCVSSHQLATALAATTLATTTTKTHISELDQDEILREFKKQPLREVGAGILTDTWRVLELSRQCDPRTQRSRRSIVCTRWIKGEGWVAYPTSETFYHHSSVGVAFEKRWFGEGKERIVKEFREIDINKRFVGPSWVAKDSITVQRDGRSKESKTFHKKFCQTQLLAQEAAIKFNDLAQLSSMKGKIPRIDFLPCRIYMLHFENDQREGFLVEPMLNFQLFPYQKFNDNQGGLQRLAKSKRSSTCSGGLHSIAEEEEDDDDSDQTDQDEMSFLREETPQAFSCFSFHYFYGDKIVCDLQGILDTSKNLFQLTDPVIHKRRSQQPSRYSPRHGRLQDDERYGRTDRGGKGIEDFKRSHRCSSLCHEICSLLRTERREIRDKWHLQSKSTMVGL